MSKFSDGYFFGDWYGYAVSKEKFTKDQASEMAKLELEKPYAKEPYCIRIRNAFVRYRVGWNENNERCAGWWLEFKEESKRSVPVWLFDELPEGAARSPEYEYIEMPKGR